MTRDEFWEHIRATKREFPEDHAEQLIARLAKLSREDIVDFQFWWDRMMSDSYRIDLWAVAYYANGGCSDDMFVDFRKWLILQGRDIFTAAVADPNSLADHVEGGTGDAEFACECEPAWTAWDMAVGVGTDDEFTALYNARHPEEYPRPQLGERWDFDNAQQRKQYLPRFAGDG